MNQPPAPKGRLAAIARHTMQDRGLLPEFSPAALIETQQLAQAGAVKPGPGLRDLRDLPWCSIDNDDSRDLDQLTVAGPHANGATTILVAVADVDALVKKGSALDEHARTNTTSVYTAGGIFPMLPDELSTDLTSLNENADREAMVIEMQISDTGAMGASSVYRALVRNHAKLAYNSVAAWLDGGAMPPHLREVLAQAPEMEQQLRTQDRVAQAMRDLRHGRGALHLATREARAVFDGGDLIDLATDPPNRAKELIEEFMVASNGVVARFLTAHGFATLRRVLREPERWQRIVDLAHSIGERLPATPDAKALETFLVTRRDANPDGFADLSLSIVKLLGRGEYAVDAPGQKPEGHFALAVRDYAHSTAPNRRFPDLISQRLLKAALAGAPQPYTNDELRELAAHCTMQEGNATKVERKLAKSAAALLLIGRIGQQFSGIVTGASQKGTFARIEHPMAEGMVVKGGKGLDVGDRVRVTLLRADVEHGLIDFARS